LGTLSCQARPLGYLIGKQSTVIIGFSLSSCLPWKGQGRGNRLIFEDDTSEMWDVGFLHHRGKHRCRPGRGRHGSTGYTDSQRTDKRTRGYQRFEKLMGAVPCRSLRTYTTHHRPFRAAFYSTPRVSGCSCQIFGERRGACHRQDWRPSDCPCGLPSYREISSEQIE